MKNLMTCLLITLILVSCRTNDTSAVTLHIPLTERQTVSAHALFEHYQFIALETNEQALIGGSISKIIEDDGLLYVMSGASIIVYDHTGKWIRTIRHHGQGPKEVASLSDFTICNDGRIVLADIAASKMVFYTTDDNFIGYINLPESIRPDEIVELQPDLFAIRNANTVAHKIQIFNTKEGRVIHSYLNAIRGVRTYDKNFTTCNGKAYFFESFNNNIYEMTPDSARIHYAVDVDGRTPPQGFWMQEKNFEVLLKEADSNGYVDNIIFFSEGKNNTVLFFCGPAGSPNLCSLACIDKTTSKTILFDKIDFNNGYTWKQPSAYQAGLLAMGNGYMATYMQAAKVIESQDEVLLKQFPNLTEDDNPIIMIAKLK